MGRVRRIEVHSVTFRTEQPNMYIYTYVYIYIHNLAWLVLASARYIVDKRILNKAKVNMGSNVKYNCSIICNFSQVCLTIRKPNDDEDGSSNTSTSARSPKIKENEKPEAGRLQKLKGKQRRLYNTVR